MKRTLVTLAALFAATLAVGIWQLHSLWKSLWKTDWQRF